MANAQSEPSMDEILASIRRIISEEDDSAPSSAAAEDQPLTLDDEVSDDAVATDSLELAGEADDEGADASDHVLRDLSADQTPHPVDDFSDTEENTDDMAAEAADDLMNEEEAPVAQANGVAKTGGAKSVQNDPAPAPSSASPLAGSRLANIISETATSQASTAFGALEHNVRVSTGSSRTIEDVIECMLGPMLKDWLESNLPRIVEEKVEEEVRRIARRH